MAGTGKARWLAQGKIAADLTGQAEDPVATVVGRVLDIAAEGLVDPQLGVREQLDQA
jgi:hypothetical protein